MWRPPLFVLCKLGPLHYAASAALWNIEYLFYTLVVNEQIVYFFVNEFSFWVALSVKSSEIQKYGLIIAANLGPISQAKEQLNY